MSIWVRSILYMMQEWAASRSSRYVNQSCFWKGKAYLDSSDCTLFVLWHRHSVPLKQISSWLGDLLRKLTMPAGLPLSPAEAKFCSPVHHIRNKCTEKYHDLFSTTLTGWVCRSQTLWQSAWDVLEEFLSLYLSLSRHKISVTVTLIIL